MIFHRGQRVTEIRAPRTDALRGGRVVQIWHRGQRYWPETPPPPPVALDARSAPFTATGATHLIPFTVGTAANRALIVKTTTDAANTEVTAVRWGGATGALLTQIAVAAQGITRASIWLLLSPASGANTVHLQLSTAGAVGAEVVSFSSVSQTTPPVATGVGVNANAVQTTTPLTAPGPGCWIEAVCNCQDQAVATGAAQPPLTQVANIAASNHRLLTGFVASPTGAVTPRWQFAASVSRTALAGALLLVPAG